MMNKENNSMKSYDFEYFFMFSMKFFMIYDLVKVRHHIL